MEIGCTYQQQGHRHTGPSSNVFDWDEELQPSQERQKHIWEHNVDGVEEGSPPHLGVDFNSPRFVYSLGSMWNKLASQQLSQIRTQSRSTRKSDPDKTLSARRAEHPSQALFSSPDHTHCPRRSAWRSHHKHRQGQSTDPWEMGLRLTWQTRYLRTALGCRTGSRCTQISQGKYPELPGPSGCCPCLA